MPQPASQSVLPFVPDALTASSVGVWETDFENDRTRGDAILAAIFGVDPDEAATGLPLDQYVRKVLPEDQTALGERLRQVRSTGGMFVIEYRTCPTPNNIRWVLARGRYERDATTGAVTGRGILIDITDSKIDGQVEDRAMFFASDREGPSLDHVAALTLEARQEIDGLGEKEGSPLRSAVDALLWAVGRAIGAAQDGLKVSRRTFN